MRKSLLLVAGLTLAACSASQSASSGSDVERAQAKFPGYTQAEYQMGEEKYKANCASCHALKDPTNFSEERLRTVVPAMVKKVNDKAGHLVLGPEDQDHILRYMIAVSMRD